MSCPTSQRTGLPQQIPSVHDRCVSAVEAQIKGDEGRLYRGFGCGGGFGTPVVS